jgi:hypothetical protein
MMVGREASIFLFNQINTGRGSSPIGAARPPSGRHGETLQSTAGEPDEGGFPKLTSEKRAADQP